MQEIRGDLWSVEADAKCVTTNGSVTKAGLAVMGAGCALEAVQRFPGIAEKLGDLIKKYGNNVYWLGEKDPYLFSFPVKRLWREPASLELIERSARDLVDRVDEEPWDQWTNIVIPRPGCGNGGLEWEAVKPVLEPILDDRFKIITWP